jgi:cell wall-associated NlpC family hydrolase
MCRRIPLLLLLVAAVAAPSGAAAPRSWAHAEIRLVVTRGLMGGDAAGFRPDDPLTQAELAELVTALTGEAAARGANPRAPVTMATLDATLVRALGLGDAAASFARVARAAGLKPPARFGTEVAARLLGLRKNHQAAKDSLERLPADAATRAEAAYSAAQILRFRGWEADSVRELAATFVLPRLAPWQARVLRTAFRFIGYPYVWGGESETPTGPFGPQAQGGFDCSGFVWRIYKIEVYAGAVELAATLRGRTTAAMSSEVPQAKRIQRARLAPGDVVFFGRRGPQSRPTEIDHMGVYVGGGWIVHSSRQGVALAPMAGWYDKRFAWARRPLAEAGLVSPGSTLLP